MPPSVARTAVRGPGMTLAVLVTLVGLLLPACGEPPVDLDVPRRASGQVVLDQAGILDEAEIEKHLRAFEERDVVALTFETEQASRGEARRAGQLLVREWDADVVLVAVARQGDFDSTIVDREDPRDRQRFFGIEPADTFDVPGGLREEIVEETVPPIAADNDWQQVFVTAAQDLRDGLAARAAEQSGQEQQTR
jgi:hypothetical protein